jgi:hypothetical protein
VKLAPQHTMATATIQPPAAPPAPNVATTHNSSSISTATTRGNLTRRQSNRATSTTAVACILPATTTNQQQRPSLTLQMTPKPPTPASTSSPVPSTSSQPSSAGSQTQFYTPNSTTASPSTAGFPAQQSCSPTSGSPAASSLTPGSSPAPSQQVDPSPQTPTTPKAPSLAPRNLIRRLSDTIGVWATVGLAIAAIIVTIYYAAIMLSYAKWTKQNDFREGCINDGEHGLPLSVECIEVLLRPRGFNVKRQIEGEPRLEEVSVEEIADALEQQERTIEFQHDVIREAARILIREGRDRPEL